MSRRHFNSLHFSKCYVLRHDTPHNAIQHNNKILTLSITKPNAKIIITTLVLTTNSKTTKNQCSAEQFPECCWCQESHLSPRNENWPKKKLKIVKKNWLPRPDLSLILAAACFKSFGEKFSVKFETLSTQFNSFQLFKKLFFLYQSHWSFAEISYSVCKKGQALGVSQQLPQALML